MGCCGAKIDRLVEHLVTRRKASTGESHAPLWLINLVCDDDRMLLLLLLLLLLMMLLFQSLVVQQLTTQSVTHLEISQ